MIKPPLTEATPFDDWLKSNYLDAYNVGYIYRMVDNEVAHSYQLAPASVENSMRMAKLIKHAWFGVYDEVAGTEFMRRYAPRQIALVGSSAEGLLGTAEQGLKVVLYQVNNIDINDLASVNWIYFGTMHHEFAHILHQQKKWPVEFNEISAGDYLPGTFFNGDVAQMSVYAPKGFVTAYSRKQDSEDVAEVTAAIICWSDEEWSRLFAAAGEEGGRKIREKVSIMKRYMLESYGIDLEQIRDVARRRVAEAPRLNFVEPAWQAQIANTFRAIAEPKPWLPQQNFAWLFSGKATRPDQCQIYKQHCRYEH